MTRSTHLLTGALVLAFAASASAASSALPQERRDLLAEREPSLSRLQTLSDAPDPILRRTVVRLLGERGEAAIPALERLLEKDSDAQVRRTALRMLCRLPGQTSVRRQEWLERAAKDPDELVRTAAVEEAAVVEPRTEALTAFLRQGQMDLSTLVSQTALRALWTYTAEARSARLLPEFRDHQLETVEIIDLDKDQWSFRRDPRRTGHLEHWMNATIKDADQWTPIGIGKPWQEFGHVYQGVGWYRHRFHLPARPDFSAADLVFHGVDESAWVWINGAFVGCHDIGTSGYDRLFSADVSDHLLWNAENVLVVRVQKRVGTHAGIWKPVQLELLKKN